MAHSITADYDTELCCFCYWRN